MGKAFAEPKPFIFNTLRSSGTNITDFIVIIHNINLFDIKKYSFKITPQIFF